MKLYTVDSPVAMSRKAALLVARLIVTKENAVLGLPTGETPNGMYEALVQMHDAGLLDFSHVRTFNLDEYVGLGSNDPNSYHCYMSRYLFSKVNLSAVNIHTLNGAATSPEQECERYEAQLRAQGGTDLQILGIGSNGHIAFNEPGSNWGSITRVVNLSGVTRQRNSVHFAKGTDVPSTAMTMGIKTIMNAREILLLAYGSDKADITYQALNGPITERIPASILQLHPALTVVLDAEAARLF